MRMKHYFHEVDKFADALAKKGLDSSQDFVLFDIYSPFEDLKYAVIL